MCMSVGVSVGVWVRAGGGGGVMNGDGGKAERGGNKGWEVEWVGGKTPHLKI